MRKPQYGKIIALLIELEATTDSESVRRTAKSLINLLTRALYGSNQP